MNHCEERRSEKETINRELVIRSLSEADRRTTDIFLTEEGRRQARGAGTAAATV